MQVLLANGKYATIEVVETEELDTFETTYNFEVEDVHTYFVSSSNILVHNDCYIDELFADPSKLGQTTPNDLYNYLNKNGYNPQPLSQSSTIKNIPFKEGGDFKATFSGDKMIYYHPAIGSHHVGAYYKLSSGLQGTRWVDLLGNIFKVKGGI